MRAIVVRPPPGDARTLTELRAHGIDAQGVALFAVVPLAWTPPDPRAYDSLLLTSANAIRHGGAALATLRALPVVAVGGATARAATAAGFDVALIGDGEVAAVMIRARESGLTRPLHLAGRDRVAAGTDAISVYASEELPVAASATAGFADATVLLHSARAATRVAALVDRDRIDRARVRLAAFSTAVADAAGGGWQEVAIAAAPTDAALIAAAIDRRPARGDK